MTVAPARTVADLPTPILTLSRPELTGNIMAFAQWCRERDLLHAPHGKTTMAPAIWRQQLEAGAWGITVGNQAQLDVALNCGIPRIMVANELVDAASARLLVECERQGSIVQLWVDSVDGVELLDAGLYRAAATGRTPVLVEVGHAGGRCGIRSLDEGQRVAEAVARSRHLSLAGIAGYEGVLRAERTAVNRAAVRRYLTTLLDLHHRCVGLYATDTVIVTAGGSTWFDEAAGVLGAAAAADDRLVVMLRSGGYVTHDHGYYARHSPSAEGGGPPLAPALRVWSRVISTPEPGLAFLDAGKRDIPYDEGLPRVLRSWGPFNTPRPVVDAVITRAYDQHARLEHADSALAVGDLVELGISHPCTAFDKWRSIPVVATNEPGAPIVDTVTTHF